MNALSILRGLSRNDAFANGRNRTVLDDLSVLSTFASLRQAQEALDERTVTWVATLTETDLDRDLRIERRTGFEVESIGDTLLHLYEHQIHHRGQVHAMMSGSSVAPPPLDEFFLRGDRPIAERELAALGHVAPRD
jgi:uncharacterized damage-inducible protein DinB